MLRPARWLLLLAALLAPLPAWAAELKVFFFDIGQGDAALIISPTGKTVLIDGGPPEGAARLHQRLGQLLTAPLDLVILSHPHLDHLGGLKQALSVKGAKLFMDPGFPSASPPYESLLDDLKQLSIPLKTAEAGRTIDLGGGASLTILAPAKPFFSGTRSDPNANSVVARLSYGKRHFYFSGDSEAETEEGVLHWGGDLSADVYKVAHHGSKHSSTEALLKAIHPSVAVISCGAHNDYGHPRPEALARLSAIGAKVLRTDQDGEVRIVTDGESLTVSHGSVGGAEEAPIAPAAHTERSAPSPATSPAASEGGYVASSRSKVFHKASCPASSTIKPANRVAFAGRDQAVGSGRTPAKDCNP